MAKRKSERERFEGWCRRAWFGVLDLERYPERGSPAVTKDYTDDEVDTAWAAWQAAKRDAKRRKR